MERREDTHDNSIIDTQFEIETQWAKKFGYKKKYDNCDVIIRVRIFFWFTFQFKSALLLFETTYTIKHLVFSIIMTFVFVFS